ncbi:PEP-CTERM sorting domain-containing protein [Massilia sp. LjRoot122]|jgi:hypothetical protein|uniref:PEP-CTERM sorting domain-containing protein n=1 Tax=Massilia sp. LjRoot122 TaxID=3342257 RepID=UPI003ECFDC29
MNKLLAASCLVFSLVAAPGAQSQETPAPDPRTEFTLSNSFVLLQSLDGSVLPLDVSSTRQHLIVRSYSDFGHEEVNLAPPTDRFASGAVTHRTGYAEASIDHIFGDLHALVGHTGPAPSWATSDFIIGSNAVFTLPARSMLTMGASINVDTTAAWDKNYFSYERGLIAATEGSFGERFMLSGTDASSYFSITALNPLDEEATFYYYSNLFGIAFAVNPVPEPSTWIMMAGGLLFLSRAARVRPGRGAVPA